jgi:hypothetical protein
LTIAEKYATESSNTSSIHLYREGTFWRVYERSAYLFYYNVRKYTVLRKEVKSLGYNSVVYMGFPDALLEELLLSYEQQQRSEGYIELLQLPLVDVQKFEAWKMAYPLTVAAEKKVSQAAALPSVAVNVTAEALLQKVQRFRLELASPIDCFLFVQELKNMVDSAEH